MSIAPAEKFVLGPEHAGMLMTPEEFDAIDDWDDLYRYELIRQVLVVVPLPGEVEADLNEELGCLLRSYRQEHPRGLELDATLPVHYLRIKESRRIVDRAVWCGRRCRPNPRTTIPSVLIDIVPAARKDRPRDYGVKRRLSMKLGVAEYWIIDRFRRVMKVSINDPAGPREITVAEHEIYSTPLLPGFELPLARLFALADQWN
jgi:Uma2 family endonuclease